MPLPSYLPEIILSITTLVSANGWFQSRKQRKAKEADFLETAARQNIENAQSVVDMFQKAVVSPLKKEVKYLRCEVKSFRIAVEKIPNCPASANCPITQELKNKNHCENEDAIDDAPYNPIHSHGLQGYQCVNKSKSNELAD
ncbi:MAG: hypothetical protein RR256_07950 [Bacteroidales bacterium]